VADGYPEPDAPAWAARSSGEPRVRTADGLFAALAAASSAQDVIRVIFERAEGIRSSPLAAPVVQVIEQIQREVAEGPRAAPAEPTRRTTLPTPEARVLRGARVEPVAGGARTRSGSRASPRSQARMLGAGGGDQRVMALVKKLQNLIHLAEDQRLAEARRQVRMAEDTAAARAEGQSAPGITPEKKDDAQALEVEALSREVLEVVHRELELRRERRSEDSDESIWW
jgi:hypothetical protein